MGTEGEKRGEVQFARALVELRLRTAGRVRRFHGEGEKGVMKTSLSLPTALVLFFATSIPLFSQSSEESAGRNAEQAGKLREALTQYVAALQKTTEGSADDQRLRETIINLVQRLSPPPAIPEEARRFSVRGQVWVKQAKNPSDFDEAAKEFGKALRVAPWWADGYINHGISLEKAGKYNEAIRSLKLYLLAAPNAPDADKVKDQIYALELRQEKTQKQASAASQEQERRIREQETKAADPGRLAGEWCLVKDKRYCEWTIKVSGDIAEFWTSLFTGYRLYLRGRVDGTRIFVTTFWSDNAPCESPQTEATISPDARRIELVELTPLGWAHYTRCTLEPDARYPDPSTRWRRNSIVLERR